MNGITIDRAKVIINNLLSEVVEKTWESEKSEYVDWLKSEVGFTDEELQDLADSGCLPMPLEEKDYEME